MSTLKEKICPKCKTANPLAANFCRKCRYEFQSERKIKRRVSNETKVANTNNTNSTSSRKLDSLRLSICFLIIIIVFLLGYIFHICNTSSNNKQSENDKTHHNIQQPQKITPRTNDKKTNQKKKKEYSIPDDFVLVPGGILSYEDNYYEGGKKHRAELDSFYICKFELTQGEYERVIGNLEQENYLWMTLADYNIIEGPKYSEVKGDSIPVRGYYKLFVEYCNARSNQEGFDGFYKIDGDVITINADGNGYRLVTPYEWVFAAYGGTLNRQDRYLGGKSLSEVAWHYGNSKNKPHPVGQKKPNAIGLFDIQGNAPELLQGDSKHKCYISMGGRYNVSNWQSQTYDPTNIYPINRYDQSECGTRIAFVPKNIRNNNLKIQYDYYE